MIQAAGAWVLRCLISSFAVLDGRGSSRHSATVGGGEGSGSTTATTSLMACSIVGVVVVLVATVMQGMKVRRSIGLLSSEESGGG